MSAHFQVIYGASVSKDTISRITDRVTEEMQSWLTRPVESVYAAVFIDALVVTVRDAQVTNRPFFTAIGVDLEGRKDVLGLWAGDGGGESSKFWPSVLTDLKQRGVKSRVLPHLRRPEGTARIHRARPELAERCRVGTDNRVAHARSVRGISIAIVSRRQHRRVIACRSLPPARYTPTIAQVGAPPGPPMHKERG